MVAIADMPDENRSAGLGPLEDGQAILDDFAVGMVEAGIDEAAALARRRLAAAGHVVEEILAVLGGAEHEGRGEENRRLHRPFRELRIEAIASISVSGLSLRLPIRSLW